MFFSRILHSQEDASLYPVQFSQFYNCYPLVNPASAGTHTDYDAAMGNQKLLGNFSKISTYYLNANMRVINRRGIQNAPFSTVGTLIYNDREGKYLNRSRFYLTYVWHGHVSKNMSVSGGFHLGGMNYSVKGTEISGDGSDIVPDGMIGVQIYNKVFQAGVSYNQIFKSQVQPLEEVATLMPYLNGTISANYKINEDILFRPDFLIRVPTTNEKQKISANAKFLWRNKISAGVGVLNSANFTSTVELRNLLDEEQGLNISLTYGFPMKKQGVLTHFVELGLSFSMDKKWYK